MLITRDTLWTSCHNITCKLHELGDTHLVNLIQFRRYYFGKFDRMLRVLYEIAAERGFTEDFLDRAQIPYKNPEGNWEIWDFEAGGPKVISRDISKVYDPDYGDGTLCTCGHIYARHFDPYDGMSAVGCKYCECNHFTKA